MKKIPMIVWLLALLVLLVALDQATKWYVVLHFQPLTEAPDTVAAFHSSVLNLDILRVHNRGVAFGFGNDEVWAPYVFFGVQVVALVGLVCLYRRRFFHTRLLKLAWVFIMAGVLGNMADRLLQGFFLPGAALRSFWDNLRSGYVVDFIDFSFPWIPSEGFRYACYHWPAFNVADACICTAAGLFIISAFFFPEKQEDKPAASAAS